MDDAAQYIADELPALLDLLQSSDVRELDARDRDLRVRVHRAPPGDSLAEREQIEEEPAEPAVLRITAPAVGTFYRAAHPGAPPLVEEGSPVEPATVVGIIEALHVLTDVEAKCGGTVSRALATDGQPVQYGQVLFEVDPGG